MGYLIHRRGREPRCLQPAALIDRRGGATQRPPQQHGYPNRYLADHLPRRITTDPAHLNQFFLGRLTLLLAL